MLEITHLPESQFLVLSILSTQLSQRKTHVPRILDIQKCQNYGKPPRFIENHPKPYRDLQMGDQNCKQPNAHMFSSQGESVQGPNKGRAYYTLGQTYFQGRIRIGRQPGGNCLIDLLGKVRLGRL